MIFQLLNKFVVANHDKATWNSLLDQVGAPHKIFLPNQAYPDELVVKLVGAASKATGTPAADILQAFGEFIVPDLVQTFKALIRPEWKTLDLLEHTESAIHEAVRIQEPDAKPPHLQTTRKDPDTVEMIYKSDRKMSALSVGIARGVAKHYAENIQITETSSTMQGDDHSTLVFKRI